MKEKMKQGLTHLKQRTRFLQGMAAGLIIMSALSYATVALNTFTSNTTISSSAMNANFATIAAKLNELDVGFTVRLSSNYTLTACSTSNSYPQPEDMEILMPSLIDHNDGNYNTGTGEYTFTSTGIYRFFLDAPNTTNGYGIEFKVEIWNGSAWTSESIMTGSQVVKRFEAGQKIRAIAGCGTKWYGPPATPVLDANKFIYAVKKF